MKLSRLIGVGFSVGILSLAALLTFSKSPKEIVREVRVNDNAPPPPPPIAMTEVLVASAELGMGKVIAAKDLRWQKWPQEASNSFITKATNPRAREDYVGAVMRTGVVEGEPIRATKIIKSGSNNFMAAMVTGGMRAVAIPVSPETAAGGFVLPNDKVDVILVRRIEADRSSPKSRDDTGHDVTTVLQNIRTLAVDQVIEERNGEKTVLARTVTLELTPEQAEIISLAKQLGTLNLSLRSLAADVKDKVVASDGDEDEGKSNPFKKPESKQLKIIKFGVSSPVASQ
jgi:pilus assembly protein CpaB